MSTVTLLILELVLIAGLVGTVVGFGAVSTAVFDRLGSLVGRRGGG